MAMKMQSVLWGLLGVLLGWRISLALPLGNHQYHDTREGSDSCAEAVAIYELPFTDSGDTWNFNDTYGNPAPDVWYSFTMVETGEMDISLCSSSFDTYLAPFVHKYKKELKQDLKKVNAQFKSKKEKEKYIYDKTYKYVYQQMQNFIFGLNVPSRWGTQSPFTNITLDWVCPDDLKEKALFL
jgi:hypothetical protein